MSEEQQQQEATPQITISKEEFIYTLTTLNWIAEETMHTIERFFQARMRYLRARGYEVNYSARYQPHDRGMELVLRIEVPDELVNFFAVNRGLLERLVGDKLISARKDKIMRELRRLGRTAP